MNVRFEKPGLQCPILTGALCLAQSDPVPPGLANRPTCQTITATAFAQLL